MNGMRIRRGLKRIYGTVAAALTLIATGCGRASSEAFKIAIHRERPPK